MPDFSIENSLPYKVIAGVDEAGRGPLCGPVVAAAVIFPSRGGVARECATGRVIINDSKKMTAKQRAAAYDWIMQNCIVGIGECSPSEIDELNILHASMLAMNRAIKNLPTAPEFILIDGNRLPPGAVGRAIVGGDAKSVSIAAASIIAKVTRDRIMQTLAREHPEYGWDKNAGYPTAAHLQTIKKYGINKHYRKSFRPVKELL